MRIQKLGCVLLLCAARAWAGQHDPATPGIVSVNTFAPAETRIVPMPIDERMRLKLVPKRGMCSTLPAQRAPDGLISGNGKMFVEVYGNPFAEQIVFHHERLLAPWKGEPLQAPQIAAVLPEVRRLILNGEYRKANELSLSTAAEGPTKPETGNLREHPAFTMRIDTPGRHAVRGYLRTMDFESGEVKVRWTDDAGTWERRTFVSRPDNAVVQEITAPRGATIHTKLMLDTSGVLGGPRAGQQPRVFSPRAGAPQPLRDPGATEVKFQQSLDKGHIVLLGQYVVDHGSPGYASVTKVTSDGGTVTASGESLAIDGARTVTLITRIQAYDDLQPEGAEKLKAEVEQLATNYDDLLTRHRPVQAAVIDRTSMDFGGAPFHAMSGEEMLSDQRTQPGYNPALLENLFDMGRYWLYLRSGDFPPIWGHVNVNVNLQQSSAVMGALPEATESYSHWVESLLPDSRVNAKNIFGARGALFAIHPTQRGGELDHFAYGWPHHYWISAGGWMYSPLWDYYLATGDREFLRQHVLPGLSEIALFYEDYLKDTDKDGNYIFVPSYSPENWPSNTESSPAVINADMDIMVCREVFTHLIEASQTLNLNSEDIPRWKAILAKLPPYIVDTDGSLKEWAWPTLEEGVALDHRHLSHMYGVWPGDEITTDQTPELAYAAWLAARKRAQGNESAHGILHRALTAARLKDAYLLNYDLKEILEEGYVNASLTTLHNPYAYPAPDPQGALPTILMEMLVYSRPGVIGLLPAVPETLTKGSVKGIVCRTQAKIDDLSWDLTTGTISVTIGSLADQTIKLSVPGNILKIDADGSVPVRRLSNNVEAAEIKLSRAHPVTLHITMGKRENAPWMHPQAD